MNKELIDKELKRIQEEANKLFGSRIIEEIPKTPTIKMVMDKALESSSVNDELKSKIQTLKDAGEFDKKKYSENQKFKKMAEEYVTREIRKSVKAGLLPNKKQLKQIYETSNNK